MGEKIVELKSVSKSFNGRKVLDGVDLVLEKGQTLVIIGCSGIGKSVTLKHIVGLMEPDEGQVFVFGRPMSGVSEREKNRLRLRIGMVFQSGALFDFLTVEENVAFALREKYALPEDEVRRRVKEALELVGLPDAGDKMPAELSGGMRKRVAVARALVYEPELMLYDEPTAGLDPIRAKAMDELVLKLKSQGKSAIVVTHDLHSAFKIGDRICMLHEGRFIIDGGPDEVRNSDNPVVRRFISAFYD